MIGSYAKNQFPPTIGHDRGVRGCLQRLDRSLCDLAANRAGSEGRACASLSGFESARPTPSSRPPRTHAATSSTQPSKTTTPAHPTASAPIDSAGSPPPCPDSGPPKFTTHDLRHSCAFYDYTLLFSLIIVVSSLVPSSNSHRIRSNS